MGSIRRQGCCTTLKSITAAYVQKPFIVTVSAGRSARRTDMVFIPGKRRRRKHLECLKMAEMDALGTGAKERFEECPSSDDLRQFGCFRKGGSGSSVVEIKRHAGDAANDDLRWSGV